jgi:MoaA/NifB/PqqE/SkfB family radical SAM enzyme
MPRELSSTQRQRLAALVEEEGLAFANEGSAQGLEALPETNQPYQIEISLGHICNDICSFCVSGLLTQEGLAKPLPSKPIMEALKRARESGVRELTLLGGEPTIQKNFFPVLECAVELGYSSITVFTNMARGKDAKFLERVARAGPIKWRVSVQGGDEQTHDHVVQRKGAFSRISQGLQWLVANGQHVSINTCVTAESVESLPAYADISRETPVQHIHLDMFRPSTTGREENEYALELIPNYARVGEQLGLLLKRLSELPNRPNISVGGLPFCFLPQWANLIHHGGQETVMISVSESGADSQFWDKYSVQDAGRFQNRDCETCLFQARCHGLPIGYAMKFGPVELNPVTPALALALPAVVRQLWERDFERTVVSGERDWSKWPDPMQKVARRLALLKAYAPYEGWAFEADLVVLHHRMAWARFHKGQHFFDLRIQAGNRLAVDFSGDEGLRMAKPAIEEIAKVLRRGAQP